MLHGGDLFRGLPELHSPHANNAAWDLIAEIRPESLIDFDCVLV
jgi:hypothetical protein